MSVGPKVFPSPTVVGSTTIGSRTRTIPPRTRKVARARGQVAGVARVTSRAVIDPPPRVTARGWSTPPGLVPRSRARGPGVAGGRPAPARSRCRSGRSRRLAAPVWASSKWALAYSIRPGTSAGSAVPGVAPGVGPGVAPGPGVGLGPGVGVGTGPGGAPASAASSRRRASPSVAAQTTWRGEATTMRVNSGNADPVDCR